MSRYFSLSLLTVALAHVAFAQGAISVPHPWPQRHHDPRRTAQSDYRGPVLGEVVWKTLQAGQVPNIAVSNRDVISLNDVWNGRWWSEEDYLNVLDRNGQYIFHKKVESFPWGAAQSVASSGGFDSAGNFLLPTSNGNVIKVSPQGTLLWKFHGTSNATNDSSIAIMADGSVRGYQALVGVFGLRADGSVMFSGGKGAGTPAIAPNGDIATGATRSNEPHNFPAVYYDNPDGTNRWTYITTNGGGSTPLFGPDGTLYIGVDTRGIYAFRPDGSIKWTNSGGSWRSSLAMSKTGVLYVSSGSTISALDPQTGATTWTVQLGAAAVSGVAIDSRQVVYATTTTGHIIAVNPDGSVAFDRAVCDKFTTGPVIGFGGRGLAAGKIGFDDYVFLIQ